MSKRPFPNLTFTNIHEIIIPNRHPTNKPTNNPIILNFAYNHEKIIPNINPKIHYRQPITYSILSLLYNMSFVAIASFPPILLCIDEFVDEFNI